MEDYKTLQEFGIFKNEDMCTNDNESTINDNESPINDNKFVYQVQSKKGDKNISLMKVGIMKDRSNILINKHDFTDSIELLLLSIIHDDDSLIYEENNCKFSMIKIMFVEKKGGKGVGQLILYANTFEHKIQNKSIIELISDQTNTIELKSFFSIHFVTSESDIILEKFDQYLGYQDMITKMLNLLSNSVILERLF